MARTLLELVGVRTTVLLLLLAGCGRPEALAPRPGLPPPDAGLADAGDLADPRHRFDGGSIDAGQPASAPDSGSVVDAGPDFVTRVGFTDGRSCCPPRPAGHPDVDPCNEAIVGRAQDTGRVGPTWTFNGERCGPQGPGNCDNHPTNQFLLFVYGPGRARACGNLNGVCGEVEVTP